MHLKNERSSLLKKDAATRYMICPGNDKAVIIVHCFRHDPRIMSGLADILYDNGFSVFNLRLKGHGFVDEEQIFTAGLSDWECQLENLYVDLTNSYDHIYCAGMSLGASLIMNMQLKYDIKKTVLYSPMLKVKQWYAGLGFIGKYFKKKLIPSDPDCSVYDKLLDEFISFFPVRQGYEAYKLSKKIRRGIKHKKVDGLCFFSIKDHTLEIDKHLILMTKTNYVVEMLEKSHHLITMDVEKKQVFEKTLEYFNS